VNGNKGKVTVTVKKREKKGRMHEEQKKGKKEIKI
jgi:hypothetical protein